VHVFGLSDVYEHTEYSERFNLLGKVEDYSRF